MRLNIDCQRCGAEDELYDSGRCWTCVLEDDVDRLLTNPDTGTIAKELAPMATALKSMKRSNSGVTWIRQKHVTALLQELAVTPKVTHAQLDALPNSRTREFVRGLLVAHGSLPRRDVYLARYKAWATEALNRVDDQRNRDVIAQYIQAAHIRRMKQQAGPVAHGTFLRSKQTVTVAIDLVNWLSDHCIELHELEQEHLDAWVNDGTTTRLMGVRFLSWAIKTELVAPHLDIRAHRRGTSPRMSADEQQAVVERVVHTEELHPRDRAAAILVLVFGQQIEHVAGLTWDHVKISDDIVTVRVGAIDIALPDPLDQPWRFLAANPGHDLTAAHPVSNWVFRGYSPGQHINPAQLRHRLKVVFGTRAARLGTLHELTKLAPVAIIAEALGYHPATIEKHATDSAVAYSQYIAAIR
ncbi:hypothetical protein [Nocardioides sp.]|uniref:hypothetical protein n=1 Tax=Nocardioides sp. TaxID=35761 RepID=UPI002B7A90F4|nr:hypothetical protein [Nocardioides sp.]HSX68603.1 hypothetical protein [Nocardioides sp.]